MNEQGSGQGNNQDYKQGDFANDAPKRRRRRSRGPRPSGSGDAST